MYQAAVVAYAASIQIFGCCIWDMVFLNEVNENVVVCVTDRWSQTSQDDIDFDEVRCIDIHFEAIILAAIINDGILMGSQENLIPLK